jgi:hypothetical protein
MMGKRYGVRLEGMRALPFLLGTFLFALLAGGLIVLLMTVGLAAAVVGVALSGIVGGLLALKRRLGLGGTGPSSGRGVTTVEYVDLRDHRRRIGFREGEIIDVDEVSDVDESETDEPD